MKQETIKLDFVCPKSWDKMNPMGDGRFCGSCQKIVTDYTALSQKEVVKVLSEKTEEGSCGHFYTHQLDKSHRSWKDELLNFYNTIRSSNSLNRYTKSILLGGLVVLMVSTGCTRKRFRSGMKRGKIHHSRTMGVVAHPSHKWGE